MADIPILIGTANHDVRLPHEVDEAYTIIL